MKFFVAAALFATAAIAGPVEVRNGAPASICPPGLYSNAQCCAAQVLGAVGLDCVAPSQTPRDGVDFKNICAKTGDQPLCCVVPVAGQDLLCQVPVGILG